MVEIRFKPSKETSEIIKKVCKRIGIKPAEFGKIALVEYLKELGEFKEEKKK